MSGDACLCYNSTVTSALTLHGQYSKSEQEIPKKQTCAGLFSDKCGYYVCADDWKTWSSHSQPVQQKWICHD